MVGEEMSILSFFDHDQKLFDEKNVEQIVTLCGDGKLKNKSSTSEEFKSLLARFDSSKLSACISYCLENSSKDSGLVLQDLVNELGKRLDFEVTNGLYQGVRDGIGFDGIWKRVDGYSIVIEVKTTDTYRINLDTIANYRKKLI